MGYSISWLAVRGITKQDAYGRMGLVPTGNTGDRDDFEASGRAFADGWTLVMLAKVDHPLIQACDRLSHGCSLLVCAVEEHEMRSFAALWQNGARVWQATHMVERSPYDLRVDGILPPQFGAIELRHRAFQLRGSAERVDHMFDVPLEFAQTIMRFKYDEDKPGEDDFEELKLERL